MLILREKGVQDGGTRDQQRITRGYRTQRGSGDKPHRGNRRHDGTDAAGCFPGINAGCTASSAVSVYGVGRECVDRASPDVTMAIHVKNYCGAAVVT